MKVKKVSKPALHADTYSVACVVNNNAEVLENALNRIKELEKRLEKGRSNQLGKECVGCPYNDEKPRAECVLCDKAAGEDMAKKNVIAEIDRQGEWLAEAGYNAYNVDIAFGSIIRALRKMC